MDSKFERIQHVHSANIYRNTARFVSLLVILHDCLIWMKSPAIGVSASTHGMIFVIMSPTGPYFPTGFKPITLMANHQDVRAWPGGTGEYKLALNYAPCFKPQAEAARLGYQQILWLLGDERWDAAKPDE